MSVTLKLADEDAALVSGILLDINKIHTHSEQACVQALVRRLVVNGHPNLTAIVRIQQLAGAFETAVRANQR